MLLSLVFVISQFLQSQRADAVGIRNRVTDEYCKPVSPSTTNKQDKQALEDLYYSLGGVAWVKNDGWMRGDPCTDNWYGICCNSEGRVTVLDMPSNLVLGQVTPTIAELNELQVLVLYNNSMQGTLPQELFMMDKLEVLNLRTNMFAAGIPEKIQLPLIRNITLSNNQLQGYIPSEWDTPNLEYLYLSGNSFQGELPSGLGKLANLIELDVSTNFLTSVSEDIGEIKSLETLRLNGNRFQETTIPDNWAKLTNLRVIVLDNMYGSIPDWIGKSWPELESITIRYGQLSGSIPTSMCELKKLQTIDLSSNVISGSIPECLCDLPSASFTTIRLSTNQLMGSIPDCYQNLHNLTNIAFDGNKLTGYLPRSLGKLPRLRSMLFSENDLYGAIPTEYSKLGDTIANFGISSNKINTVEDGLEPFFNAFADSGKYCSLYSNPWTCPLPTYVTTSCSIDCSKCNTPDKHASCTACVADSQCGWCNEGGNCLAGSLTGPSPYSYSCSNESWIYEFQALCKN